MDNTFVENYFHMLQTGHYILLVVILVVIGFGFNRAATNASYTEDKRKKLLYGYTAFIAVWVLYVSVLASTGFLADYSLPPKIAVFTILPAFGIIGWFFRVKKFKNIILAFPISLTVYFQSFRIIVELLIWGIAKEGFTPELVSFNGRNFDILAGLTAPIIGYWAYSRKAISHKVVIIWNICCLMLLVNIVFIFLSLIIKPEIWGYSDIPITMDFPRLPYVYIAAFFMPAAVFMHIFSIKKSLFQIRKSA